MRKQTLPTQGVENMQDCGTDIPGPFSLYHSCHDVVGLQVIACTQSAVWPGPGVIPGAPPGGSVNGVVEPSVGPGLAAWLPPTRWMNEDPLQDSSGAATQTGGW